MSTAKSSSSALSKSSNAMDISWKPPPNGFENGSVHGSAGVRYPTAAAVGPTSRHLAVSSPAVPAGSNTTSGSNDVERSNFSDVSCGTGPALFCEVFSTDILKLVNVLESMPPFGVTFTVAPNVTFGGAVVVVVVVDVVDVVEVVVLDVVEVVVLDGGVVVVGVVGVVVDGGVAVGKYPDTSANRCAVPYT